MAFRVADKPFVSIEKNNTHAGFALDKSDIVADLRRMARGGDA